MTNLNNNLNDYLKHYNLDSDRPEIIGSAKPTGF